MEGSSQGSRRTYSSRPESRGSNNTRMTSTTSDGSADHLPQRTHVSTLLQDRLRERKSESARHSRRVSVDMESTSDRAAQSSPLKSLAREERRPSSSGISKTLGVKQIEEQVSTLHKQNFDLKLELYHRRQRQETLEARLELLEKQRDEQAELQEVNEQLLAELEKRDQAVEEAVGIIVTLENKVETLQDEVRKLKLDREHVRAIDAEYDTQYFQSDPPSSPPAVEKKVTRPSNGRIARMPSFMSENSEGTEALRSLYLPHNRSYSDATLPKLHEESVTSGMNSPRLSNLSESSFVSIYGEKPRPESPEEIEPEHHLALVPSAVEKWVDDRPLPTITPPQLPKSQFRSISHVMESPLQRLEKLEKTLSKHNQSVVLSQRSTGSNERRRSKDLERVFIKTSFENQQGLPPTPDTISTSTLRHYQNSDDALRMKNGTFFISTSTFPSVPGSTHNAYQSAISMRPRSAGETVTSRREGHGWDTETQDDITTDAASISSQASDRAEYSRPQPIQAPNLFTFGGADWGRDMMFNNESSRISPTRWNELRRSSMIERDHQRSDDTVIPSQLQTLPYNPTPRYQDPPLASRLDPPDRRSSVNATTKLRKSNPNSSSSGSGSTPQTNAPSSPLKPEDEKAGEKKHKLSALRIFKRSERGNGEPSPSLPTSQSFSFPHQGNVRGGVSRTLSHFNGMGMDNGSTRATPPPIRRNRTQAVIAYRPSSAGTGSGTGGAVRRVGALGFDGAVEDERVAAGGRARRETVGQVGGEVEDEKVGGGGLGRKWFGIGRAGSVRRN